MWVVDRCSKFVFVGSIGLLVSIVCYDVFVDLKKNVCVLCNWVFVCVSFE